ncbi:MAG: phosphoribosylamine--glycine ligase [Porticoccaceae bacterium]|nr:phosphoribosylamine--glycine ligase [Porticoccaceae bacterium]|tara:strand:+ start:648 stop:1952 length:1305 start_codon:yes stop_codon:yes gene_type:complete
MKVLIVGAGGREHALAWKIVQSPLVEHVYVAPGNAGTAQEDCVENIDIRSDDLTKLADFAQLKNIGLTIVGPEKPLVDGIVDLFLSRNLKIFGPTQAASQLEGSKEFSKAFLVRNQIPTAKYESFSSAEKAIQYIQENGTPIVIKANGLAAGKGVVIADNMLEAKEAINDMLERKRFGEASRKIVIEEFLEGEEASFIVMVDGKNILPMATSQDYKRAGDGDIGPNTGGMGACSPAAVITPELHQRIIDEIISPTVKKMADEGNPYSGFLYAGLMISKTGALNVVEFNCRFGDPEAQPVLFRMKSDLAAHCLAAINGQLHRESADWEARNSVGVVLASKGYPEKYKTGSQVTGISGDQKQTDNGLIFHAGTTLTDNVIRTSGGRVFCITALGNSQDEARLKAYELLKQVECDNLFCRKDIGLRKDKVRKSVTEV